MALILNLNNIVFVLTMKDCIDVVEKAFAELSNGSAYLPMRIGISPPEGVALYMPAYLKEMDAMACKVVSVYNDNPSKFKIPRTIGKIILQDPHSGNILAIMDGGYIAAVRTGAASAVASRLLARKDAGQTVGIFGAGIQGKTQLWGMSEVRNLSKAYIYDVSHEAAEKFATNMSKMLNIVVEVATEPDTLTECDIICTATSSKKPLFDGTKIKPGTHINGIGSHSPSTRELDSTVVKRSKFVGDNKEVCFKEAGDIIIPIQEGVIGYEHFYAELGEIITGKKAGRVNDKEITIFKANGLAIQDVATAKLVYDLALEKGIGTRIDI